MTVEDIIEERENKTAKYVKHPEFLTQGVVCVANFVNTRIEVVGFVSRGGLTMLNNTNSHAHVDNPFVPWSKLEKVYPISYFRKE